MGRYDFEPTDAEKQFVDERWPTIYDRTNPGLDLILEREGARFWRANMRGPGTYIGLKNGRTRLVDPAEFKEASIYAARLFEIWKGFEAALIEMAKQRHSTRIKRSEIDPVKYRVRLTGCYTRKLPPMWIGEGKGEAKLTCQLRLLEGVIACTCVPEAIWSGKTLHLRPAADRFQLLDDERPVDESRAAEKLLNEFTDGLDPWPSA